MAGGQTQFRRREVVRATGTLLVGGTIAGCTSGGSADVDDVSDKARKRVDAWLADTGNYGGEFEATEPSPPYDALVDVGVEGNGGNRAFAPPAWIVPTGHTIIWQWTGEGRNHNVVSAEKSDFEFDSGAPKKSGKFEKSLDSPGVALYYCEPHRSAGMKGAIVVVE